MSGYVWNESGVTARLGAASELGNYRDANEDCFWLESGFPLALVLDGMGGGRRGVVACLRAIAAIRDRAAASLASGEAVPTLLDAAFRSANDAVRAIVRHEHFRPCGATVVGAFLHGGRVHIPWVGDSMAYRLSGGRIDRLTEPHDYLHALIRAGRLTEAETRETRIRNVLVAYLGDEFPDPFVPTQFVPKAGDGLLLTTDGVTSILPEGDVLAVWKAHPEPQACADRLVELALERSSRDNCACVVIAFDTAPCEPEPELPRATTEARPWWRFC